MTDKPKPPETPGMAEVSAKFVDEAEAATSAPPSSASVPDDPLIALGRQWKEVYGKWTEDDVYPDTSDQEKIREYEEQRNVLLRTACQLEDQAAEVSAQSIAGVLVQLRMAGTHYHLMERDGEQWANTYAKLTWQAWDSLERLAGERTATVQASVTEPEDPVLALKREWETRWERYVSETDESDEATDPLHDALNETAYEIFQTPAMTPAGIAFKLVLWARQHVTRGTQESADWSRPPVTDYSPDLDHLPVVSALHDLERMVGVGIAVAPAIVTEPTDPVVLLGQCWEEIKGKRGQLKNRNDENPKHPDVIEDERLHDIQLDIEKSIADTPTRTAAGVAVKLRHLQRDDEDFDGMSDWHPAAFRTALEALAHIAG